MWKAQSMVWRTAFFAAFLLCACTKSDNDPKALTLETGISVLEAKVCDETVDGDQLAVQKQANGYMVLVSDTFACGESLRSPWLGVTRDKKATLVLASEPNRSGCECRGKVRIQIKDRLESGDTLYVMRDSQVIGHIVLP
jgi:hypothetical protein